MSARPSVGEERWLALAARHPALRARAETAARGGAWKSASWLSRCLFFGLGLVGAAMILGSLQWLPAAWLLGGTAMLGCAEWLIRVRRHFRLGLEEALWTCGALCWAFGLQESFDMHGDRWLAALFALALLAAGLRLLNALLTTLAALLASLAIVLASPFESTESLLPAVVALGCGALAFVALLAGGARLRRPSHDRMLDGLVIAMPLAACAWASVGQPQPLRFTGDALPSFGALLPLLLALVLGGACLGAGLRRRRHAPLFAALGCVVGLAWSLRAVTGLPLQARLMLWGTLALVAAVALERRLRRPAAGFTSLDTGDDLGALESLHTAGTLVLGPRAAAAPGTPNDVTPVEGGGGSFGGGGASGRY